MKQVILARDRRRKKNRLKGVIFLMALVCVAIGIGLTLKNEETYLPQWDVGFDDHVLLDEDDERDEFDMMYNRYASIAQEENNHDTEEKKTASTENENADLGSVIAEQTALFEELSLAATQEETRKETDVPTVENTTLAPATSTPLQAEKKIEKTANVTEKSVEKAKPRQPKHYSYTVTRGDRLQDVLAESGLPASQAKGLERKFPQLTALKTGQQFQWGLDAEGNLAYMHWFVSEKEEQRFTRTQKNQFAMRKIEKQGVWKQDVLKGTINGGFVVSMQKAGLSPRQIQQLASGLQWQIATNKLKKGDRFAILLKREYLNGKVTGVGNVEAIHVLSGNKSYYAIQADNGRYYNRHGETLGKGFARYPLRFTPRVSSSFNPYRRHPISGRVRSHRGVDFALPVGTPIIAPADGIVEHVAYQAKGAGYYIKVRHGGQYMTVYMHLSRQLVKVGQRVKKGDRIALSGNTGGSTGPHLHYEFHINGNPVNPMTVKLPGTGSGMPANERKAFLVKARNVEAKLRL